MAAALEGRTDAEKKERFVKILEQKRKVCLILRTEAVARSVPSPCACIFLGMLILYSRHNRSVVNQ